MNTMAIADTFNAASTTWRASLSLDVKRNRSGNSTRLARALHHGPLYVQKPFYPEGKDYAHIYLLHPPGGFVSGDETTVNINASQRAGVLLTTPGAAKMYRARADKRLQIQKTKITIKECSCVEWFPHESIIYNNANARQDMQIVVSDNSCYIGWEILCLGLPLVNRPFEQGRLKLCTQLYEKSDHCEPQLLYRDNIDVTALDTVLTSLCGFNRCSVNAYLLAKFPVLKQTKIASVEQLMRDRLKQCNADNDVAITTIGSLCISRYLGNSTADAKRLFIELWRIIRPVLIEREAVVPRIWHT